MTLLPDLIPGNETQRLAALREYRIMDTAPEACFDDLAKLLGYICEAPIAYISLIDADRQWFKSKIGLDIEETPREISFCAHTILQPGLLVVPDTMEDERFARSPLVVADPKIRFYAGAPLIAPGGEAPGALCVMDRVPRRLTPEQADAMAALSRQVVSQLELRRQVQALRESQEATGAILDNLLNGIITVDGSFALESINPAACKMFGYEPDEVAGRHWSLLVPEFEDDPGDVRLGRAVEAVLGKVTEWEGRRKDGTRFPYELTLSRFETAAGRRLVGHLRDLSELRQVERIKKEFVATVSHELRTPLTSIRGSLGLLATGAMGELPEDAREMVGIAERNCVRLIGLINDILDLERLGAGKMELQLAPVPVPEALQRSVDAVRGMAEQHGIDLEVRSCPAAVYGDADRLMQVLVNLISNAIKFSPRGSAVTVAAQERGSDVEISVADRGRGIPAGHLPLIFERFQQVEACDSRQKGGTGLGLAICRSIVELHGGAIGVESREGEGSRFWFRVPRHGAETSTAGASAEREARPGGRAEGPHVLLIEDDPSCRRIIARLLSQERIPVRTASTGREALQLAVQSPPGLLVLDLGLPELDGFEVVQALLREPGLQDTPLLVFSGTDLSDEQRSRLNLGPTRFLTKSRATDETFREEVVRMLQHRHPTEVFP